MQIFIGTDENEAALFAKETFHVKKPLEEAEEDKAKPSTEPEEASTDFKTNPVGFLRARLQSFSKRTFSCGVIT
jgi:calnexin